MAEPAANVKVTELLEASGPSAEDLIYLVDDPGGSPTSRKITVGNFLKGFFRRAVKTADQSNGSAVLANDTHLWVNVDAGRKYTIAAALLVTTGAADEGVKVALSGTAIFANLIADIKVTSHAATPKAFLGRVAAINTAAGVSTGVDVGSVLVEVYGGVEVSAAGTLLLAWAKNASLGGTNTIVRRGSFLQVDDAG